VGAVSSIISNPKATIQAAGATYIYWVDDAATFNVGWVKLDGVDWQLSYDWDMGNWGAFNTGIAGTYYLHQTTVRIPGASGDAGSPVDAYYDNLPELFGVTQNGVSTTVRPRHRARGRFGWSNGQWDATIFANYDGHFWHTQSAPPNVNNQCLVTGGTVGGGSLPCAISNYTSTEPSYYTFDLSIGFDTGDEPENAYLKNVGIQLTIDNLTDRSPPFEYRISTGGGNPSAFDILKNIYGRVVGVRLTKTW
jgi:hypothetical protein